MTLRSRLLRPLTALADFARPVAEIPFVPQMQWTDCGASCLAMVMGHNGSEVQVADLRRDLGAARDGVNARVLLQVAERHGLLGRGIKLEVAELELLPRASILHWQFNHFVVFDRLCADGVRILDPACGPRTIPMDEFGRAFTGIALVFEQRPEHRPTIARPSTSRWHHLHRLWRELVTEKPALTRVLVLSILLRIFALAVPLLTGLVVDQVVPRADRSLLAVAGLGVVFMVGFDVLTSLLRAHLLLHLRTRLDTRMTLGFLEHLISLPYSFFQSRSTGDLLMRVSSNSTVREILTANTLSGIIDGCLVIVYGAVIFLLSPALGLLVTVLAVAHISIYFGSRRRYRQLMVDDLEAQAKTQGCLVQMLAGIETLKSAGAEHQRLHVWQDAYSRQLNMALRRGSLSAAVDVARRGIESLAPVALLALGAAAVMAGDMTLGSMLAVNSIAAALFRPLSSLVHGALQLQLVGGYLDRIDDVLDTPREQSEQVAMPPPLEGAVSVRKVSFRYSEAGPWAVNDVSLDIAPGSSVAIVGPSGSGKSTLAALLVGLHRPSSGEVYYDGNALSRIDIRAVRRQMGVVPQSPFVFAGTIRENIALAAPDAELSRVAWAAQMACIHSFIETLPMGYDTPVSDSGSSLSGGQRQRLAIARALLASPAVLMLDEATSALDSTTERQVLSRLARTRATRIVVAHRLSTVVDADTIIVMNDGKIVESGSHRELLARGGLYHRLAQAPAAISAPSEAA